MAACNSKSVLKFRAAFLKGNHMNRVGNLWESFISESNIKSAILKSIKGKRDRADIMSIAMDPQIIKDIQTMLNTGQLPKHKYRKVVIYEGKKRNIYVIDYYPWRIIHHMVINIIEPIFEARFIDHTYGCIRGRGQHKGSKHCWELVKRYKYCLKCDIHKFYPSINQNILSQLIHRVIKDKKLLHVIDIIVFSHCKGCPIGNLPSQLFGNIYLSQLDYFVKHVLRFKNYIRYVDDFLFLTNNKEELHKVLNVLEPWLKQNLGLTLSKSSIFKTKQGIDFLGYRHFKGYKLLRKRTAQRMIRRVNRLEKHYNEGLSLEQCMSVLCSFQGWIKNCNSYNLSKKLDMDKVRKNLTYKDFQKHKENTFIIGQKTKVKEQEIIVNAYSICKKRIKGQSKDYLKIQYYDNKLRYIGTSSSTIIKQFKQLPDNMVPFKCNLKFNGKFLYAT